MRNKIKRLVLISVCFSMVLCLFPAMSWARLVVQTEIVSGKIVHAYDDHSVKLNNGKTYQPSREGLTIDLPVGASVTLRIVEQMDK
nr:hypothetical protein [Spirochaetales bacterium]